MKWYSTKEHQPVYGDCIIRLQNKNNPDICCFEVAHWNCTIKRWIFSSMEFREGNYHLMPTHFAIIEPAPAPIKIDE